MKSYQTNVPVDAKVKEILSKLELQEELQRVSFTGQEKSGRELARVELRASVDKIATLKNKSKVKGQDR
jgi:hypothetical protein